MKNIFIIGSKGIPSNYGGFETFVENLTNRKVSNDIKYYVSCLSDNNEEVIYNDARCFNVKVADTGSSRAVLYDIEALKRCINIIENENLKDCTIYILACRIGPFIGRYRNKLQKMNVKLFVNPDGHEWKRSKWNGAIKKYWKLSEKLMVKHADLLVCDSIGIEKYIKEDYKKYNPKTTFIAYGADVERSSLTVDDKKLKDWYSKFNINSSEYYLIVGRFVPENNYYTMIKEFMKSNSKKDLVIITNHLGNKYYEQLKSETNMEEDSRIKFVGTVYDQELIKAIRENAFAYLHGHEVGGTNPSLLEALASTKLNILLDVSFNKEVGRDSALYFNKTEGNLAATIEKCDALTGEMVKVLDEKSTNRIIEQYSWENIIRKYEELFLSEVR
ncbi:MAG: DUF1972 domain-containing protein [Clostridium sp.]